MSLSLADILTSVKHNHGRLDQAGNDTKDAIARVGVKLSLQEISRFHEFEITRTSADQVIAANSGSVDLPAGVLRILEVRWVNGLLSYQLPLRNRELVLREFSNLDSLASSYPIKCYLEGTKIYVAPRTSIDAVIRLNYSVLPAFSDSDDSQSLTPDIPLIDKYIIEFSTAWVFQSLQMFNESQVYFQKAGGSLQAAIDYDSRHPFEDRRIQPVGTVEPHVYDPLDPFNFAPNSWANYYTR